MYGHVKEAVKLNDGARVIDYTNINARLQIADNKTVRKFRELDESLNEIARQFAERDTDTENLSLRVNRQFQELARNSSRQSETFDMSTSVQQPRLPEQAFPGQAFPQCNVAGPQQPQTYPNVTSQPKMYGPPIAQIGGADETYFGTCTPPTMRVEPPATGLPADRPVPQTPEAPPQVPTRQPDPRYMAPGLVPPQAQYGFQQQAPPTFCQQPMPPIPPSFSAPAAEPQTPLRPTTGLPGALPQPAPNPFSPVGQGTANPTQRAYWHFHSHHNPGKTVNFEISRKKNDQLKIFQGSRDDYELWHDRHVDHIASNCNMWNQILQYVEEQAPRIKRQQIETLDCMGFNAWEIAVTLGNYLVLWLSNTLYRKRKNLCGGEEGNGFELWRRLCADHEGQIGDTIKQARAVALHTFPKCEKVEHLGDHLDAWRELKEEFGQKMSSAPGQLLVMFKKTLPTSITNALTGWPSVRTYEEVLAFCRRRTDYRKEHDLCEFAKRRFSPRRDSTH